MKLHTIMHEGDLQRIGEVMRTAAQRDFITSNPSYSKDEIEAAIRALPLLEQILKDDGVQALVFPGGAPMYVSVALSVDAFDGPKRWHLSMVSPTSPTTFKRVPDYLAVEIAKIIVPGSVEGPTEGGIKASRHFFAPYVAP